ncbi:protein shisa-5-like [Saccostrea cucullata]|uniref:protein shisa-5-like n=1 Tax=Saccostrea cuccullata TaxID=36930 RepID=UPI002ED25AD2
MWRIQLFQVCMVLMTCWFAHVFCDSDDFEWSNSESESSFNSVRNATISIASIIGIITGLIFLVIVIAIIVICCCCMKGRRSAGHVYRQPGNQMTVTTTAQQSYLGQYPPPQPYNQYPPVQNQYPPQGYVQYPPPPQMGYPPVQQAPPMTGSGYPPQENKALPTAPPADDDYPPYPANPQQPPPYPGN